jgi:hypothetical protein
MIDYFNPFEYETANKLSEEKICDFYIEDYNYSRFIRSKRNIFLVGARGTGKTMTLLYNSLPVQIYKAKKDKKKIDLSFICIHVPCNTTLIHKKDYQLINQFQAEVVSEHFLVVSIMYEIVDNMSKIPNLLDDANVNYLIEEIEFSFDVTFPQRGDFFKGLKLIIQKEVKKVQQLLNSYENDNFSYPPALSFSSGVLPLVTCLRNIPSLSKTHFALMLDDSHDLNSHQIKAMNSWVAYRDNTIFSFKVALAKVDQPTHITRSGGAILEGHDYTQIDMDQPYHNKYSSFGKLAHGIIQKRLSKVNIHVEPEMFFPLNNKFESDLKQYEEEVRAEAESKYGDDKKKITDHIYKYARAKYFKGKAISKSNRPPYSGFEILVHMSTGVIRNLLDPCYWMYDSLVSEIHASGGDISSIKEIPPNVQREVILDRSKRKWEWIEDGLANSIDGCSLEEGKHIYQLFDQLAILFRNRLLVHESEPRAVTFTISDKKSEHHSALIKLLDKAKKAQILYTYRSSAKDSGSRETYYVPNRILWPERGLDPVGQHARVSLKSSVLWEAAVNNKEIPFAIKSTTKVEENDRQQKLWDKI